MSDCSIFGINEDNSGVNSSYIPFISFATRESRDIAESYVIREAESFFKDILKIEDPVQLVQYSKTITCKDFNKVGMEYFYNTLFFELGERDSNGRLIGKLKWSIAFDEEMTPIQVARPISSFSSNNRKYGLISVNGEPVFYYLYFTLQEILDALKKHKLIKY